uniref:Lipoprotein n=1 Tax=Streptomyces sp. NBC_00049 TaxID=2903617 RepID=A0AAU2JJY5_9ACTN
MRRGITSVLAVAACAAALSACTDAGSTGSPGAAGSTVGPTATSTAAPAAAAALAERYRQAGGDPDVYGIEHEARPPGAPLLIIRTHNADTDHALFDKQAASIAAFLTEKEGLPLSGGYLMDVFGPDGRLLHRWDTTA